MKNPIISVVMPVYKGEAFIKEAIDSILSQSFADFELLIINDASPDQSEEVILSYDDSRVVYIKHETNKGLVGALNTGLENAKGKYVARMDQDDISHPNRLQLQHDFMESNPDCILLGTQAEIINSKDKLQNQLTDQAIRAKLIFSNAFVHPTVMMRKEMLDKNKLRYSEAYKHAEDYGFWIDLSAYGKLANLPQTGLYYRKHETQYTVVFNRDMFQMVKEIRTKYLQQNGVTLTNTDLELFEVLAEKRIDFSDEKLFKEIGALLSRLPDYFDHSPINANEVKRICYYLWRRICDDRQKKGYPTYKLYTSNALAFYKFNLKSHFYYFKNDFLIKK